MARSTALEARVREGCTSVGLNSKGQDILLT